MKKNSKMISEDQKIEMISEDQKIEMIDQKIEKIKKERDMKNIRLLKIIKDQNSSFFGLKIGDEVCSEIFSRNKLGKRGYLVGKIIEFHTFPNKSKNSTSVKIKDENGNVCYRVISRLIKDKEIKKTTLID